MASKTFDMKKLAKIFNGGASSGCYSKAAWAKAARAAGSNIMKVDLNDLSDPRGAWTVRERLNISPGSVILIDEAQPSLPQEENKNLDALFEAMQENSKNPPLLGQEEAIKSLSDRWSNVFGNHDQDSPGQIRAMRKRIHLHASAGCPIGAGDLEAPPLAIQRKRITI